MVVAEGSQVLTTEMVDSVMGEQKHYDNHVNYPMACKS